MLAHVWHMCSLVWSSSSRFLFGWVSRNAYKRAIIIGVIAAAVNIGAGLLLLGVFAAPLLAVPAGILAGLSVCKEPRFAGGTGSAGTLAGTASGLVLTIGSSLSGVVVATIGSAIESLPSSSVSSSNDTWPAWSLALYLNLTAVGFILGILAFIECVIIATLVGATNGWRNRPLPPMPVIYE